MVTIQNTQISKHNTDRNYGIDLLRLVLMFMVVVLHTLGNGGVLRNLELTSPNYYIAWFIECMCYCAVNCYALITGYVSYNRQYKLCSLLMIWIQTIVYTLGISALFFIMSSNPKIISLGYLRNAFLSSQGNSLWYVPAYSGLYILIPVLNGAVKQLDERASKAFLLLSGIAFTFIPTFSLSDPFSLNAGYSTIWLAYLYLLGALIHKFNIKQILGTKKAFISYISCIVLMYSSKVLISIVTHQIWGEVRFDSFLIQYTSPIMLLAAVGLFLSFVDMDLSVTACKMIKRFSPAAFGVYLIHCQPYFFELCRNRFGFLAEKSPVAMLLGVIGISACIYFGCIAVDMLRIFLFQKFQIKRTVSYLEQKYLPFFTNNES